METVNKHVSIRKFLNRPVDPETMDRMLYAASRASNTGNMQAYSMVVTTDLQMKEKLAPLHFNQKVVTSAPALITFLADFHRFSLWCEQRNADPGYNNFLSFFTGATDALLAAQNFCVAAESMSLGICYLGTTLYNAKEIIELLHLPKLTFPVTTVAVGYPDEHPDLTDRLPLDAVVHHEQYRDYTVEDIDRLYAEKEALESMKQFVIDNEKETLAQVFTDVRYKREDNIYFSDKMLDTLKKQNFIS